MSMATTIEESLTAIASQQSPSHTAIDVYRIIHEQAKLLLQTECARENLTQDPLQALAAVDTDDLCQRIRVVDYECIRTRQDYVRIYAEVAIRDRRTKRLPPAAPKLVFLFEREASDDGETCLSYSIDFAPDPCRAAMKLLLVRVLALGSHPSQKPARSMDPPRHADGDEDDDADWSDVDSESEEKDTCLTPAGEQAKKNVDPKRGVQEETDDNDCDRFLADMDPDVLDEFITLVGKMDQATAFFLLMSFPFYEMEWDIIGFVLDSVFGPESDEDDEGNEVDEPPRTSSQPKKKSKRQ